MLGIVDSRCNSLGDGRILTGTLLPPKLLR